MTFYQNLCYNVVSRCTEKFALRLEEHQPAIFNITGEYRNRYHEEFKAKLQRFRINMILISVMMAALTNSFLLFCIIIGIIGITFMPTNSYTIEFVNINGFEMAVAIPTREEEGKLEARNFEETGDINRLYMALGLDIANKKNIVVISVGSTSAQVIYGHEHTTKTEFDMGVDNQNNLQTVFESVTECGGCDYVCFMNAIGYGIKVDAGIVISDNVANVDTVTENIVARTISGTGNNTNAMTLVSQLVELHKTSNSDVKIAFVPRGDPTMPQGGSHSKQRLVDAIRSSNGLPVVVIEISGKQTKRFYIDAKDNDWELDRLSTEELCKLIKETKVVDENGKTYGSGYIFR